MSKPRHNRPRHSNREKSERIVEIAKITAARLKCLNRAATVSPTNGGAVYPELREERELLDLSSGKNCMDDTFSEILKLCDGCTRKDLLCEAVYDIKHRLEA